VKEVRDLKDSHDRSHASLKGKIEKQDERIDKVEHWQSRVNGALGLAGKLGIGGVVGWLLKKAGVIDVG
jgi:hypothetical protein